MGEPKGRTGCGRIIATSLKPRLLEILEQVPSEFTATEAACLAHSHPGNEDPSLQVEEEFLGIENSPNNILVGFAFVRRRLFSLFVFDLAGQVVQGKLELLLLGGTGECGVIEFLDFFGIRTVLVLGQFLSPPHPLESLF